MQRQWWQIDTAKGKRVVVAMSGGIDSSVCAGLLKEAFFDVIGVFFRFWKEKECKELEERAKEVARILNIPLIVIDVQKEFKKRVVDYFLTQYKKGVTPNPCVVCNKDVKFKFLIKKMKQLKGDFISTGHYAKVVKKGKIFELHRAKDKHKDQSYFLWRLTQSELKRLIFPIGEYKKQQIKKMAKSFGFYFFDKNYQESKEVCFIAKSTREFLLKYLGEKKGKILSPDGKFLGWHKGVWFYTIGQRRGLGLSGGPFWVLKKDVKRNILIVTPNRKDLLKKEVRFKNINWISDLPSFPLKVKAKIRYHHKPSSGSLISSGKFVFSKPQESITPGQSIVFYQNNKVLGGGVIY